MYKRTAIIFILVLMLAFTGCAANDALTTLVRGPYSANVNTSDVKVKQTLSIYYDGEFVTKTVFVEEYTLNGGAAENLQDFAEARDEEFQSETFNVKGFEYTSELNGGTYTITVMSDYRKMNHEEMSQDSKDYFYGVLADEDFNILYDKTIAYFKDLGFSIQGASTAQAS